MKTIGRSSVFILLFSCLLLQSYESHGQNKKPQNLPKYDYQPYHFGFTLGINNTDFNIKQVKDFLKNDSLYVIESKGRTGFNLGIIANLHLGDNFDLRFIPALSFANRDLVFSFVRNGTTFETESKTIESTFLDFPLDLKFKSMRLNNFRMYVLGGIKYSKDLAGKENVNPNAIARTIFRINDQDWSYEYGIGMDFYLEYFKFSMDIKLSRGLKNLLVTDETAYTTSIDKLYSNVFLFSLNFE